MMGCVGHSSITGNGGEGNGTGNGTGSDGPEPIRHLLVHFSVDFKDRATLVGLAAFDDPVKTQIIQEMYQSLVPDLVSEVAAALRPESVGEFDSKYTPQILLLESLDDVEALQLSDQPWYRLVIQPTALEVDFDRAKTDFMFRLNYDFSASLQDANGNEIWFAPIEPSRFNPVDVQPESSVGRYPSRVFFDHWQLDAADAHHMFLNDTLHVLYTEGWVSMKP